MMDADESQLRDRNASAQAEEALDTSGVQLMDHAYKADELGMDRFKTTNDAVERPKRPEYANERFQEPTEPNSQALKLYQDQMATFPSSTQNPKKQNQNENNTYFQDQANALTNNYENPRSQESYGTQ